MFLIRPTPKSKTLPPRPEAAGQYQLQLGTRLLEYQLQRSQRRSVGFQISEKGLRVSAPSWLKHGEIEEAIRSKQNWILQKLALREQLNAEKPVPVMQWQDGESFPFQGKPVRLRIVFGPGLPSSYDAQTQELTLHFAKPASPEKIGQRARTWLQAQAEHHLRQRLAYFAPLMGVTYTSMALSSARTQWGSCSSQGIIRLNWRLIYFQPALLDYVVIHELAHRHEMNHSPRFWAHVGKLCPAYKPTRAALQQAARTLATGL